MAGHVAKCADWQLLNGISCSSQRIIFPDSVSAHEMIDISKPLCFNPCWLPAARHLCSNSSAFVQHLRFNLLSSLISWRGGEVSENPDPQLNAMRAGRLSLTSQSEFRTRTRIRWSSISFAGQLLECKWWRVREKICERMWGQTVRSALWSCTLLSRFSFLLVSEAGCNDRRRWRVRSVLSLNQFSHFNSNCSDGSLFHASRECRSHQEGKCQPNPMHYIFIGTGWCQ